MLAGPRLLARVHHECLCRLFACSTNGPRKCLLLECMSMSLDKRLVAKPALGWEQRVAIIVALCRALVHLHSLKPKPMIHRDVKSQNILLAGFESGELSERCQ